MPQKTDPEFREFVAIERALLIFTSVLSVFLLIVLAYLIVWPLRLETWPPPRHFVVLGALVTVSLVICAVLLLYFRRAAASTQATLAALAYRDALTGIYNYRYINMRLEQEIERSRRYGRALSLMYIDMDGLKKINDRYGHAAGDEVLRETGIRLESNVRAMDLVGRAGGDEFVVILPETPVDLAQKLAKRLCTAFSSKPFMHPHVDPPIGITISIGVAGYSSALSSRKRLVQAADAGLYDAKAAGGNGVAIGNLAEGGE